MIRLFLLLLALAPAAATAQQVSSPSASKMIHLYNTGAAVASGADTTEDTIVTYTMPANTLVNVGDTLTINVFGSTNTTGTSDNKTVRIRFGGSIISSYNVTATTGNRFELEAMVVKTGSNTQAYGSGTSSAANNPLNGTLAITDTANIAITVTGQNATNSNSAITMQITDITLALAPGT